jgi:nitrite reductase/ring-hydroxylating ferredoxin subunit
VGLEIGEKPVTRRTVVRSEHVLEGQLLAVACAGQRLLLTRVRSEVFAVSEHCPHLGFSMAKGCCVDGVIECPWHGSRFDVRTGANIDWVCAFAGRPMPRWSHGLIALGRSPAPLKRLEAGEADGQVWVELTDLQP